MATIKRRTVLFADFRGSTALYEALGNAQASSVVSELMRPLVRCIPACGGQLVKTLGDGLMAVFPNSTDAVIAAVQMQEELERLPPRALDEGRTGLPHLQVAITAGEVVEMGVTASVMRSMWPPGCWSTPVTASCWSAATSTTNWSGTPGPASGAWTACTCGGAVNRWRSSSSAARPDRTPR
jgi:hypothetical protein